MFREGEERSGWIESRNHYNKWRFRRVSNVHVSICIQRNLQVKAPKALTVRISYRIKPSVSRRKGGNNHTRSAWSLLANACNCSVSHFTKDKRKNAKERKEKERKEGRRKKRERNSYKVQCRNNKLSQSLPRKKKKKKKKMSYVNVGAKNGEYNKL